MKEGQYAILVKTPDDCLFGHLLRCPKCEIDEILLYKDGKWWYGSYNFTMYCPHIDENCVNFISEKLARKILMAMRI